MFDDQPAYTHRLAVRFRDCDMLSHVNNAVYFTYFEEARIAWWRQLSDGGGFPGANTVVVHAECDYRSPALLNETLDVQVWLVGVGRSSCTFGYRVTDVASGRLVAEGKTVSVTIDPATGQPIPVPEESRRLLGVDSGSGPHGSRQQSEV